MGDREREDEDLEMAIKMSMQHEPPAPEPKRSKPRDVTDSSPEAMRRLQRELMAAAAEKRMLASRTFAPASGSAASGSGASGSGGSGSGLKVVENVDVEMKERNVEVKDVSLDEMTEIEAEQLFSMVFGSDVSKGILAQWSNQGIRFSPDPETSMGLVQHEGGPCGVLAAIQAFVLKYLLFFPDDLKKSAQNDTQISGLKRWSKSRYVASDNFASLPEDMRLRALVKSMGEILFLCGSNKRAVVASLSVFGQDVESTNDENISKALEGFSIESASDLQKFLRVNTYVSQATVFERLESMVPVFQSRMGAMLFLISALLSRGLDCVQADRDDPTLPLVTAPFGHASQEIVNLLLCGQAVANVFDGRMDLGGGMFLKGVGTSVEVGFLTLLESLNFCKVGQNLKCPRWPIWVVGSESHYTILFALDSSVQAENELEERESRIRRAFDAQDQSGGGGFISVEGFQQVLKGADIRLTHEKADQLCSSGFIVWSEFWQAILDLDKSLGGLKDSSGLMGKKVFDLYHFNGIAKSDLNGSQVTSGGETPLQRPRLTKLKVSVPPKWTPEEYMATETASSGSGESGAKASEGHKPEPAQHAPLVDCIRTRWPRAVCNWVGDPPSIV